MEDINTENIYMIIRYAKYVISEDAKFLAVYILNSENLVKITEDEAEEIINKVPSRYICSKCGKFYVYINVQKFIHNIVFVIEEGKFIVTKKYNAKYSIFDLEGNIAAASVWDIFKDIITEDIRAAITTEEYEAWMLLNKLNE